MSSCRRCGVILSVFEVLRMTVGAAVLAPMHVLVGDERKRK